MLPGSVVSGVASRSRRAGSGWSQGWHQEPSFPLVRGLRVWHQEPSFLVLVSGVVASGASCLLCATRAAGIERHIKFLDLPLKARFLGFWYLILCPQWFCISRGSWGVARGWISSLLGCVLPSAGFLPLRAGVSVLPSGGGFCPSRAGVSSLPSGSGSSQPSL